MATDRRNLRRYDDAMGVLEAIARYRVRWGFSPSLYDLAQDRHMSRSNVSRYLDYLGAWGFLDRQFGVPRSIHITDRGRDALDVWLARGSRSAGPVAPVDNEGWPTGEF